MNQEKYQKRLSEIKSAAVYCGSHEVENPCFAEAAAELGKFLAEHGITLVYGGSNAGMMKLLADSVLDNGGKVIGIFTGNLPEKLLHPNLSATFVASNLAERKAEMLKRADVVIALPGSFGTWDELFDALALRKIRSGGHKCPVGVLNVNGYFDHLLQFIQHSAEAGFTSSKFAGLLKSGKTPDDLFKQLAGVLIPKEQEKKGLMKISTLLKYKWQIIGWAITLCLCLLFAETSVKRLLSYGSPAPERACINDRNGTLLLANRNRVRPRERKRIAFRGGKFAANVIGFTSIDNSDREIGMAGIEKLLNGDWIKYNPVYLSLDYKLQSAFEDYLEQIYKEADAEYVYAAVIRGNGEILTMAQRPVIDLNDRRTVPERGMIDFNTAYRFPVTDELMRLLGSSSAAQPAEKERLGFTKKTGVLPNEVRGHIPDSKDKATVIPEEAEHASATALIYLRAYAAAMEKKDLPQLCLHADKEFSKLSKPESLEWKAVSRSKNEFTVTAAGIIRLENGEKLYCFARSVHKSAEKADFAEQILKSWRFENDQI